MDPMAMLDLERRTGISNYDAEDFTKRAEAVMTNACTYTSATYVAFIFNVS